MPSPELITYGIPLVDLNASAATFHNENSRITFTMPVKEWVDLGRPGFLYIQPTPKNPFTQEKIDD